VEVGAAELEVVGGEVEVGAAELEVDAGEVEVGAAELEVGAAELEVDAGEVEVDVVEVEVDAGEAEVDAGDVRIGGGALQTRNVISSITRSFPYPPGAFDMIKRVTEVVVAVNERPYFTQVSCWVDGMLPEVI
jgi:hypothetical protein